MSIMAMMAAASVAMWNTQRILINRHTEKKYECPLKNKPYHNDGFTPSLESFKVKGYANMVLVQALEHLNYSSNKDIKP